MDLKSLMNTSDEGDRPSSKPAPLTPQVQTQQPPYPPPQHQHQQPHPQTPTTPAQGTTSYAFRESAYSHALHASPGKPPAPQEYAVHAQPGSASYAPPPQSPYQTPGPYPGRPQPTLQTQYSDPRSPAAAPVPGPSPYRQMPGSSSSASAGSGYPFPPTGPNPESATSPVQRHQYPPTSYPPRDSYSHISGPPLSATAPPPGHPGAPYAPHQQQPPHRQSQHHQMPQTPPIGTPAAGQPYVHQRSQSTHSTPTPTSAQSQHQYGQPYPHGSPVATTQTTHPPPPPGEFARQPSQPPTPSGPPLSGGQRQSSAAPSFAHPPSPYQQRMSTTSLMTQPLATPPPPPPPSVQRMSNSHAPYDNRASDAHGRSQSHSERGQSMSVSPKTRVPSIPSSAGGQPSAPPAAADVEMRPVQPSITNIMDTDRDRGRDRATTPAKRKLADRDLSPRELENTESRPPPGQVNGSHAAPSRGATHPNAVPKLTNRKKRVQYASVPVWAQTWNPRDERRLNKANFELQKRGPPGTSMNGKPDGAARSDGASRHPSPEAARSSQAQPAKERTTENGPKHSAEDLLGPWEPCVTGIKPYEEIPKAVADFIFLNVVGNPDAGEILNREVQFEIEAKLGTLIDKDTNERIEKFVSTECLLHDTGRVAFRSSMTAAQHKGMNDWLNDKVVNTNPQNPDPKVRDRVQVQYKHRREVDKFFELPNNLQGRLPGCVRARLSPRHAVKVRVTYDQKTGSVLQKIVKARVADLNIHMPACPLDCRISVNLEAAWDGSVEELEQLAVGHDGKFSDRSKDRLSYVQSHYQIDLTQVTQQVPGPGTTTRIDKEHELEIELAPGVTIDQGGRALSGEPHRYAELVEGFVDNVRVLARTSGSF